MPVITVSIVLQVLCVVHILRTGRDRSWIFIVFFLSIIGVAAYFILEILPSLINPRAVRGVSATVSKQIDPGRAIREWRRAIDRADTVENRKRLAEALLDAGEFREAAQLYEASLTGVYRDDPALLFGLARAYASLGNDTASLEALDAAAAAQPASETIDRRLFRAMRLEKLRRMEEAEALYAALSERYPGEEARCRYARLLAAGGRDDEARALYETIVQRAQRGDRHYRRAQREWIDCARQALEQNPAGQKA